MPYRVQTHEFQFGLNYEGNTPTSTLIYSLSTAEHISRTWGRLHLGGVNLSRTF